MCHLAYKSLTYKFTDILFDIQWGKLGTIDVAGHKYRQPGSKIIQKNSNVSYFKCKKM